MFKASQFVKKMYRIREVAEILGVTAATVRNYDRDGRLKFERTAGNQRVISREDLMKCLYDKGLLVYDDDRHDIIYVRKPTSSDRDPMKEAAQILRNTSDLKNPRVMEEIADDNDRDRSVLRELIDMVCNDEVNNVYVTDKDTLIKFGYNYLRPMFLSHNTDIVVLDELREVDR